MYKSSCCSVSTRIFKNLPGNSFDNFHLSLRPTRSCHRKITSKLDRRLPSNWEFTVSYFACLPASEPLSNYPTSVELSQESQSCGKTAKDTQKPIDRNLHTSHKNCRKFQQHIPHLYITRRGQHPRPSLIRYEPHGAYVMRSLRNIEREQQVHLITPNRVCITAPAFKFTALLGRFGQNGDEERLTLLLFK